MEDSAMNVARITIAVAVPAIALALLHGCGSSGSDGNTTSRSAVSLYVTDDLGDYQSVSLTLNSVQLRHTGSGASCEIISGPGPVPVDAAELGHQQLIELVDTTNCEARPYNRLHVELDEDVSLIDNTGTTHACKFTSYRDAMGQPNRLTCSNGLCTLDINGAVNLVAGGHEHVALDADLKEFTVDFTRTPCEVTLKLSPLHAEGIEQKVAAGYRKGITGLVSALDTTAMTFTLTGRHDSYLVQYAGVSDQIGIDTLLGLAAVDGLRTRVRCESINPATMPPTCVAQISGSRPLMAISVVAKGTVSGLDTGVHTFTLSYPVSKTLAVNYHEAFLRNEVEGTLANTATVEAALYGFATDYFLAREVEVGY
jgi:hypothetical protein